MEGDEKLPAGWMKVKSKSRPNKSYFYNAKTKISLWKLEDLKDFCKNESTKGKASKLTPAKSSENNLSSTPKKTLSGTSQKSKNIARERMTKLKNVLADGTKREPKEKLKELKNVCKPVGSAITRKNIAYDRMKGLNDELKKEVKNEKFPLPALPIVHNKDLEINKDVVAFKEEIRNQETSDELKIGKKETFAEEIPPVVQASEEVELMDISYEDQPEDYEAMDWEEIPEEKVIEEIQKIRTKDIAKVTASLFTNQKSSEIKSEFFVVIDTNVLLSNLEFVKEIKGKLFKGKTHEISVCNCLISLNVSVDIGKATIYLPYIVLCELDRIKAYNDNLARLARRAINFIDECFKAKDAFMIGESAVESARNRIIPIDCGDDEILNCCLKVLETTRKLLLLTNDKNLRNKAFVNHIEALSRDMLNFMDFNAKNELNL